jgi:hypothetical protein
MSEVKFPSTRLKTLSASPAGSSPTAVGPPAVEGASPRRGQRMFLASSTGHTGPTYAHNRHISVK